MSSSRSDSANPFQNEFRAIVANIMKIAKANLHSYLDANKKFTDFDPTNIQSPWTSIFKSQEETELASSYEYCKCAVARDLLLQFDVLENDTLSITNVDVKRDITHLLAMLASYGFNANEKLDEARINFKQDDSSKLFRYIKLITRMANKSISDYCPGPISAELQAHLSTAHAVESNKPLHVYGIKMPIKQYESLTKNAKRIYPAGKTDAAKQTACWTGLSAASSAVAVGAAFAFAPTFGISGSLALIGTGYSLIGLRTASSQAIGEKSIRLNIEGDSVVLELEPKGPRVVTRLYEKAFYILSHKNFNEIVKTGTDFIFDETNPNGCQILFNSATMAGIAAAHFNTLPGVYHEIYGFNMNGGWKEAEKLNLQYIQDKMITQHSINLPVDISASSLTEALAPELTDAKIANEMELPQFVPINIAHDGYTHLASAPSLVEINQNDAMKLEELRHEIDLVTINCQTEYANAYPLVNVSQANALLKTEDQTYSSSTNYIASRLPVVNAAQAAAPVQASASTVGTEPEITPAQSKALDEEFLKSMTERLSKLDKRQSSGLHNQTVRLNQHNDLQEKNTSSESVSFNFG